MGTISSAFSLISGALNADQAALSIVANNVANANTPGYTRGDAELAGELVRSASTECPTATGVTETGATSVRDRVLLERLDQQQQLASASTSRLTALNTMQALFTPDSGSSSATAGDIGSDITSFFNSFSSLEANPTNNALRQQVLSTATTLAGDISNAANSLNAQRAALDQEAAGVIAQVNALTGAIAQLNQQIQSTSPTADAGRLEDQRQQDLSKLVAVDRHQPDHDGKQRALDHHDLGPDAGLGGIEHPVTTGTGERGDAFLCGDDGHHVAAGIGRRPAGRISDGARPGHSQRADFTRSTGLSEFRPR